MSTPDKLPNGFDVKVIVSSAWYGNVPADTATEAEEAARAAFDDGELKQCSEEIVHVDVRPAAKTFCVTYAVEQGFTVSIDAATATDAEAIVKRRLSDDRMILAHSECGHFEGTVIDAVEVMS